MSQSKDLYHAHYLIREGVNMVIALYAMEQESEEVGIESVIDAVGATLTDNQFRMLQRLIADIDPEATAAA
jgi:hypothetical protein